ncbi:MAG TPA: HrcA family transcriptional regulator, partial [Thermoanaerobaculia bacterium]|nr:HrcA family transcriptional regulator [Thermoanaerobaculia bacterium]
PLGYHFFIDALMQEIAPPRSLRRYVNENLGKAADAESLTLIASHLLSELSDQVSIVLVPARAEVTLRSIEFVPLPGTKVLCVVVSSTGFIDNKVIDIDDVIPREDLTRISSYLTENFAGLALSEVRNRLLKLMAAEKAQVDTLMQRAFAMAKDGLDVPRAQDVVVEGTGSLLSKPEMKDLKLVQRLFQAFADKAQLVLMLNRCMEGQGVRVVIGKESDLTSSLDFSLIATSYGVGHETLGSLGILGPSRMEYPRLIPLVHFLGEALSAALTRGAMDVTDDHPGREPR